MESINPNDLLSFILQNHESEVVEFKHNNYSPEDVSEYVSALANGAVMERKDEAYLVFGIDNDTRSVVGTTFNPDTYKKGSNPFKNWLATVVEHADPLKFVSVDTPDGRVEMIVIPRARRNPVKASGVVYLRVGESKKSAAQHPELERKLWDELLRASFEEGFATSLISGDDVLRLLDITPYFDKQDKPLPNEETILEVMVNEGVIIPKVGMYLISNFGAVLFARDINDFPDLSGKVARLIRYQGTDKRVIARTLDGGRGFAVLIDNLIDNVVTFAPVEEYLRGGSRRRRSFITRAAVRELVTNMLIHQDFNAIGYAPRVEIFDDRIEFSNAGEPVISKDRFLDLNKSRNPRVARLARAMNLCEEQGTGFDIVERACEQLYLPSPSIMAGDGFTKVTVFSHKTLRQFSAADRVNLVYMHSCLQFGNHGELSNQSLRQRFPAEMMSSTVASRWITEALDEGRIKPSDSESQSRKYARYLPFWAA